MFRNTGEKSLMTGRPIKEFCGLWNLNVAIDEYHKKHGLTDRSEDYDYTFPDGSVWTIPILTKEKEHRFVDKDWTPDQDPDLKHWYRNVSTKSFVVPDLTDETFRSIKSAKKFIDEEIARMEKAS